MLTIGRLEAALALNNERVLEIFPELKVEDGPLREFALAEVPRMIELFDVSDCLEILSRMGEPDLLAVEAALRNLQATSYSDYVIEHRRIQLLSQSPEEDDRRRLRLNCRKDSIRQRPRPTVGLFAGSFDDLKLDLRDSYGLDNGSVRARSNRDENDAVDSIDELYEEASALVPEPEDNMFCLKSKQSEPMPGGATATFVRPPDCSMTSFEERVFPARRLMCGCCCIPCRSTEN